MKLGLNLGYWGMGNDADNLVLARDADDLGYSVVWAAESWGSDAVTVLAWVAAQTTKVDVGSAIMQIPARSAAMTAMTAATLDSLSGGRFRLGLGLSGPQVSEGWHGVRYDKPLGRQREYVEIVNKAVRREKLVFDGEHYQLPLPDGPGKALHLMIHPVRDHIPTYLAAVGPKNLELAGEIVDGVIAIFFAPDMAGDLIDPLTAGRAKAGKPLEGFDVVPTVPVSIGPDPVAAAEPVKAYAGLYVGGMGSREKNFYNQQAIRMGYEAEAKEIQDLWLGKKQLEAMGKVPFELVDRTSLVGPVDRVADGMQKYAEAGITTLTVAPFGDTLEARRQLLRDVVTAGEKAGVL